MLIIGGRSSHLFSEKKSVALAFSFGVIKVPRTFKIQISKRESYKHCCKRLWHQVGTSKRW